MTSPPVTLATRPPVVTGQALCELAAHILFLNVSYLKTLTQLSSLPLSDQVTNINCFLDRFEKYSMKQLIKRSFFWISIDVTIFLSIDQLIFELFD